MSKPCYHCIEFLKYIGIKRVFYSDDDGNIICEKVNTIYNDHITGIRRQLPDIR